MTFAEVLPALEAGREAKWKTWIYRLDEGPNGFIQARGLSQPDWKVISPSRNLILASDWELVEEPHPIGRRFCPQCRSAWDEPCAKCIDQAATIARLERESAQQFEDHRSAVERMRREFEIVKANRDAFRESSSEWQVKADRLERELAEEKANIPTTVVGRLMRIVYDIEDGKLT